MRILICPDSFKESLTAVQAAAAIARGVQAAMPQAECRQVPLADGGEGTLATLLAARQGRRLLARVSDPLGQSMEAEFGLITQADGHRVAVIEMAAASGLHLVPPPHRNPMLTTTYGTGELIRAALDLGIDELLLAIGGSATCDGGMGLLKALGIRFLDAQGASLGEGGGELIRLARLDLSGLDPRLRDLPIRVASDVDNPLCGPRGAAAVFAPQKGAAPEQVMQLDASLAHYAACVEAQLGLRIRDIPGAGAAGGLGAGLLAFLGAELRSGIELVSEAVGLAAELEQSDLVITGEGCLDGQTLGGKVVLGVAHLGRQHHKSVIALAGRLGAGCEALRPHGLAAWFAIAPGPLSLEDALTQAESLLEQTAHNVAAVWLQGFQSRQTSLISQLAGQILVLLREVPQLSAAQLAERLAVDVGTVAHKLQQLQQARLLQWVGTPDGGHWQVLSE